jgi:hypothetical protein
MGCAPRIQPRSSTAGDGLARSASPSRQIQPTQKASWLISNVTDDSNKKTHRVRLDYDPLLGRTMI